MQYLKGMLEKFTSSCSPSKTSTSSKIKMSRFLSNPPVEAEGHRPDRKIYREPGPANSFFVDVKTKFTGYIPENPYDLDSGRTGTKKYKIAVTTRGDKGPLVLLLHGVPTNRAEWVEIQKNLAPFCRTIAFDMLGMGESDQPRFYGLDEIDADTYPENTRKWKNPWDWENDVDYIEQMMQKLHPGEKFIFLSSDWGGGIGTHYAEKHSNRLLATILLDPVAFDGYPVSEIQAIGRASQIEDDEQFMMSMGAIDQTMVQILKTMTYDQNIWNQYKLRDIKKTYTDVDYERSKEIDGEDADSLTLRLKFQNVRVLCDRSAVLAPAQLLPIEDNPRGVDYDKVKHPVLVIWGAEDNMMNANQGFRFLNVLRNAPHVSFQEVAHAGHFVEVDQPDLVSEIILIFIVGTLRLELADPFLGFTGTWKGDEAILIEKLREKRDSRNSGTGIGKTRSSRRSPRTRRTKSPQ